MAENKANKVKFGLKNVYYAKLTFEDGTDGKNGGTPKAKYDTPKPIPGAVSLSLDFNSSAEPWYADDIVYVTLSGAESYEGTLEVALLPDSFLQDIFGDEKGTGTTSLDEILYEKEGKPIQEFALMFEFDGDKHKTRHVFYRCTATRPSVGSETKTDSAEPTTDEIDITAYALPNGYVKAKCEYTETPPALHYTDWFNKVHHPAGDGWSDSDNEQESE